MFSEEQRRAMLEMYIQRKKILSDEQRHNLLLMLTSDISTPHDLIAPDDVGDPNHKETNMWRIRLIDGNCIAIKFVNDELVYTQNWKEFVPSNDMLELVDKTLLKFAKKKIKDLRMFFKLTQETNVGKDDCSLDV